MNAVHQAAVDILGGDIEILVNNAGGSVSDSTNRGPLAVTIDEWEANYRGNTLAAARLAQRSVPAMVASRWGRIIQISSAVGAS